MALKPTRIPRHLEENPSQFTTNRAFREESLLLPNGVKVQQVRNAGVDFEAYCQEHFGKTGLELLAQLKRDLENRLEVAVLGLSMLDRRKKGILSPDTLQAELEKLESEILCIAKQGYVDAQAQMGVFYCVWGRYFGHSENEGVSWLEKAYKKGHSDAATELGTYHLRKGDIGEAIKYYQEGDRRGCSMSRFLLARIHQQGAASTGVNLGKAFTLFKRAAMSGHPEATVEMVKMYLLNDIAYRLPASPIEILEEAIRDGSTEAMYLLGDMYEDGMHAPKDLAAALEMYRMAAGQGMAMAQLKMGNICEMGCQLGYPAEQNLRVAMDWYSKAANNPDDPQVQRDAHFNLGSMNYKAHNYPKALIHWNEAAALGCQKAAELLAMQARRQAFSPFGKGNNGRGGL